MEINKQLHKLSLVAVVHGHVFAIGYQLCSLHLLAILVVKFHKEIDL